MILEEEEKSIQSLQENPINNQFRSYGPNFGLKSLNNRIKLLELNCCEFRAESFSSMEYKIK